MDFWKVVDGKIEDNWVMVDFPYVLAQLGVDCFNGEGWEAFDRGERVAHHIKPLKQGDAGHKLPRHLKNKDRLTEEKKMTVEFLKEGKPQNERE